MKEDELQELFRRIRPRRAARRFRLGDTVRIRSGPFAAFDGKVEGINQSKSLLKIKVKIFGAETFVKLRFSDVETVSFS